jgi:hypothetical protein
MDKVDSREVYEDKVDRSQWCECNADKACDVCIDDEMYGVITTTQEGDLPAPPPYIIAPQGWESAEGGPLFNKVRESGVEPRKPSDYQVDGPKSCDKYYESCSCKLCSDRDRWWVTSAT